MKAQELYTRWLGEDPLPAWAELPAREAAAWDAVADLVNERLLKLECERDQHRRGRERLAAKLAKVLKSESESEPKPKPKEGKWRVQIGVKDEVYEVDATSDSEAWCAATKQFIEDIETRQLASGAIYAPSKVGDDGCRPK